MEPLGLRTEDGLHLAGELVPATGERRGVVVLVHGFAASRLEENVRSAALTLADTGYDVVTYDARGHGESGGRCTLGDDERLDVAAAVDAARDLGGPIVVVGASMGAIAALRYVASSDATQGLVTVSSPAGWRVPTNPRTALASVVTQTGVGRRLARRYLNVRIAEGWSAPAPPVTLAPHVHVPWTLVHGRQDKFIAPAEAIELRRSATPPTRLTLVADMGHAFDPKGLPAIVDGVDWALRVGIAARR